MESVAKLNPAYYREIKDEKMGLKGFVVIDKQANGTATGGIRMAESVTLQETANLAHEMTLKFAFLNIKKDGAKSGIVAPSSLSEDKKRDLCEAFGKRISDLIRDGRYFPGEDLGISADDLSRVHAGAGAHLYDDANEIKSEYFTALTVYLTTRELLKSRRLQLNTSRIIIEGFGKVGEQAAKLFSSENAKIVGISTYYGALYDKNGLDIEKICALKKIYGDMLIDFYQDAQKIKKEDLFLQNTDILIPGARPDSIHSGNIDKIQARMIVPIANIATTEKCENALHSLGKIYVPGFVSNCGGILSFFISEQGFSASDVERIIKKYFPNKVRGIIEKAHHENKSISRLARECALRNITQMEKRNLASFVKKLTVLRAFWLIYKLLARPGVDLFLKPLAFRYIAKTHLT